MLQSVACCPGIPDLSQPAAGIAEESPLEWTPVCVGWYCVKCFASVPAGAEVFVYEKRLPELKEFLCIHSGSRFAQSKDVAVKGMAEKAIKPLYDGNCAEHPKIVSPGNRRMDGRAKKTARGENA